EFDVLDPHVVARRERAACVHACRRAPARHAAASAMVRRGSGRALGAGFDRTALVAGGASPAERRGARFAGQSSVGGAICVPNPAAEYQKKLKTQISRLGRARMRRAADKFRVPAMPKK